MPDLNYGTSSYARDRGNFPETPVVNMFAESVPVEEKVVLQSRPGMANTGTSMGAGPVYALFKNDGVLTGALYGISGTSLYENGTLKGAIDGSGPAKLDGYEGTLFATKGSSLWGYDGVSLAIVAVPDSFSTLDLCVGASRLVVIRKDTGKFYWSDALTSNIDALSFATAENSPDKLKACLYVGDALFLFGSETVECWPASTDGDAPFQPLIGRTYDVGIKDTGCATQIGSSFAWVTNHNQVCVVNPENIISNPDLEARIEASSSVSLWTFRLEGIEYLALRLDDETNVYNSRSGQWSLFETYGVSNWSVRCFGGDVFGSATGGNLVDWTSDHSDFGGVLERRFRAGLNIDSGSVAIYNLQLRTNPGYTPFLTGDYADPTVEAKFSNDGGVTWTAPKGRSLGTAGQFRPRVQWRSLGYFGEPGFLVEFRVTDPVPFRVSRVLVNEPYGRV